MERRDFLKAAGLMSVAAVGASALAGCTPKKAGSEAKVDVTSAGGVDPATVDWSYEHDVIVVGSGSAGYCASIEAAEAGSNVLVLEKNTMIGGDSTLCGGVMQGAGFAAQEELGSYKGDTGEKFADHMLRWAQGFGNEEVIRETCLRSGEAIEWIIDLGRVFDAVDIVPLSGNSIPKKTSFRVRCGAALRSPIANMAVETAISLGFRTRSAPWMPLLL